MPLRLDIKRKLTARSDRVKSVDLHPTEPWMVASLYNGSVCVWNHETQTLVKTFEVCDLPVRVAKFVARKHWVIAGADDMQIRVFNYNTLERSHMFEAHSDYIRCIAVHPTQPYILTSSDDMLIKLWDWDRKWVCGQVFEGHTHYVMQIVINPKDNNQFASASLDRTIKVWQLGSNTPNFTLEGHEKGVNCIDYYSGGDKPYLISGADDRLVKIWDYQNKTCVQTLEGHAQNVSCVSFHPELPIILTGSEDGTVRVWHSSTYRLENTLNYGMERVWCVCGQRGSNSVALGYDEGSILIKLGREEPAMSMDASGKIMWARHSEVQQANLKAMGDAEIRDGERLPLAVKDMGSCEIYPQTIQHNPNGRFVVVCGDGEYIIYTAMALRNKSFGSAQEFVWAHDSSEYAIRESNSMIKIFKNFKEKKAFKPDFGAEGIHGGFLLGVKSTSGLAFYDWENAELVRRIEIQPKHIFWSDSGELVCIATEESFFVLRYLSEKVAVAQETKEGVTEDGIEDAFEVLGEIQEVVKTGIWVGDCFIYTSSVNRLNYYVGGEIVTIAHLDRTMYLLGYIPKDDRLYLGDKELNIVSFSLLVSVLEYQTAVMRRDFSMADRVLPTIPKEQRTRVAHFLEKQGFRQQALGVSTDPEHRFELALQLGELKVAYQLAIEAESEQKWKQLAELATTKCQFGLAQECLHHAQDYGGLLLLATASGNASMVGKLAEGAERDGKTNVAFLTYFLQGKLDKCLDILIKTNRLPEAAFLARTYLPSHVSRVVKLWKDSLSKVNQKAADALADPTEYGNLFPGLQQALLAETYLRETHVCVRPAAEYPRITPSEDRSVLEESSGYVPTGGTSAETVAEFMKEPPVVAEVVAAAAPEAPVLEEAITMEEEEPVLAAVDEPVAMEEVKSVTAAVEESIAVAAEERPVTEVEQPIMAEEEAPISVEVAEPEVTAEVEDTITKQEEVPVTAEGDLLGTDTPLTIPDMVQSPEQDVMVTEEAAEDVASTAEVIATDPAPLADAVLATEEDHNKETVTHAYEATLQVMATEEAPVTDSVIPEAIATEKAPEAVAIETVVATEATVTDANTVFELLSESIATEEVSVTEEVITEAIATEAIATEATPVTEVAPEPLANEPTPETVTIDTMAVSETLVTQVLPEPIVPAYPVEDLITVEEPKSVPAPLLDPFPAMAPVLEPFSSLAPAPDPATAPALDFFSDLDPFSCIAPVAAPASPALPGETGSSLAPIQPMLAPSLLVPQPVVPVVAPTEEKPAPGAAEDLDMDDEGLDDLDLDNFDLDDDIDTSDVNLDDDFMDD
ncbi:coatomer subunit beta'-like [Hypomesus transpacificus]|uniref:coatomer subunit beta'-like n=1 Tax=Hypomesus transpacificus TaxID=137520 RepID=UPI001F0878CD|nr:coatomer subunit beta'-like [Hypomesus transpacificus]